MQNSTVSSDSCLEISQWSDQCHLDCLSTVNFLFQGQLVPISLRPVPRIVAAYVMATVWSSCSQLHPPGGDFSIYKTAQRIWLRILSLAFEEELLKVFDFVY